MQKMILKALRNFHHENDAEIENMNTLAEVTLLYKKQLYDSAHRVIEKYLREHKETDFSLTQLRMYQLEYQIQIRKGQYEKMEYFVEERLSNERQILRQYENLCEYRYLQGKVLSRFQIEGHTTSASTKYIRELLSHPLLASPDAALSFLAKMYRYEVLMKCQLKIGDEQKAYALARELYQMYKQHPDEMARHPYNFFVSLNSLTNRCIAHDRFEEGLQYCQEAEAMLSHPKLSKSQLFEIKTQTVEKRMVIYTHMGQYEKALAQEKLIAEVAGGFPLREEYQVTTHYFSAICYLGMGRHNEALKRTNHLINESKHLHRKDLVLCAHWLNIFTHVELGNYSIMKRLFTITANFIAKSGFPEERSKLFIKELKDFIHALEKEEPVKAEKAMRLISSKANENFDFFDHDFTLQWMKKMAKRIR